MKYTILFLLLPFIGLSQIRSTADITWYEYSADTIICHSGPDPYLYIDLPEEECQIWYVMDFGTLAEYQGPAKLEWERIPEDEMKYYRVTRIKNVHVPGSKIDEWRMIKVRNKTIWR